MYYEINEELARTAHYMVHMSEYKTGSATESYKKSVDEAAALVEEKKKSLSPFYHEKLDGLLDAYARRLATWYNDYNKNQAAYPSQFISGAGGYNMRKHEKQMSREKSLWAEYDEIKNLLHKIKATGTGGVDFADPNAREILLDQIAELEKKLADDKALNAYYRKHKSFVGYPGISDEKAEKLSKDFSETRTRCPWIDTPVPAYELTSIRGKIKRLQSRLADLEKLQAATDAEDVSFDGGRIVRNVEQNRLQIIFDTIPEADLRAELKGNGFRWSPSNQAWQRQLTDNAMYAAKKVLHI